jgi:hypothetical protein
MARAAKSFRRRLTSRGRMSLTTIAERDQPMVLKLPYVGGLQKRGISIATPVKQSPVTGDHMKSAQSKAYALVESGVAARGDAGVFHSDATIAQPLYRSESALAPKIWNQMVDCEARNALQVILSGSEILLDHSCRISPFDQKAMLERILASAHHLNSIIATLTRPDDLIGEILIEGAPEQLQATGGKAF